VSFNKFPPIRSQKVHTPPVRAAAPQHGTVPPPAGFAEGTDRAPALPPAQARARSGDSLPDLFDPADLDGETRLDLDGETSVDHRVAMDLLPVRRSREATRMTPVNEEKIWARSLEMARARVSGDGKTPPRGNPPPLRPRPSLLEARPAPRPRVPEMPTMVDKAPPPMPPPPRMIEKAPPPPARMIEKAPPPMPPPARMAEPAQVIDLAVARAQRASTATHQIATGPSSMPPPTPPATPSFVATQFASSPMASGQSSAVLAQRSMPLQAPAFETRALPLPAPVAVTQANPYAVYEQIGLGAPAPMAAGQRANKAVVSTYRFLGFVILTVIVVVLVGYISTSVFYMVSDSWIQPMVVSPTDERVLTLKSELAEKDNLRDKVALELQHTERFISSQQEFQAEFVRAVKADLAERKTTLRRLRSLASGYAGERSRIRKSNRAFAQQSKKQMTREYAARLIDRSEFLAGAYQLGQIATSNLSLAERQVEFETRAQELDGEARALEAILSEKQADGALSYEVLKVKQEYDSSRLETTKALESREALKQSLARYDAIIQTIKQSPFLRAADQSANVAFVPYSNLDQIRAGAPVYACALEMIACSEVGQVKDVLAGEVTFKHPFRDKNLRGQMVELDLDDVDAVAKSVLFVGDKPLLF
jgi:hypothetical protein